MKTLCWTDLFFVEICVFIHVQQHLVHSIGSYICRSTSPKPPVYQGTKQFKIRHSSFTSWPGHVMEFWQECSRQAYRPLSACCRWVWGWEESPRGCRGQPGLHWHHSLCLRMTNRHQAPRCDTRSKNTIVGLVSSRAVSICWKRLCGTTSVNGYSLWTLGWPPPHPPDITCERIAYFVRQL